ncbi:MAG: UxaA family hydrolase, partial [Magnetococcales bacterium]|nr:UxaA family hydrolase [Magnetococcales bacterium]
MFIIVHPGKDNVAVSRSDLDAGTRLSAGGKELVLKRAIRKGERFALVEIPAGEPVIQYGVPFGRATGIAAGEGIHGGNVVELPVDLEAPVILNPPVITRREPWRSRTFAGYARPDGGVGVRNHFIIVPTSMCASQVANQVAARANARFSPARRFPNVDSIVSLANTEGCGCASNLQIERFLRVLRHHLIHPNVGGALIIDLGCEQTDYRALQASLLEHGVRPGIPLDWLTIQKEGGVAGTVEKALHLLERRLPEVNANIRTPQPAGRLLLGTECGASDSFSGLTANPVIGNAADKLIAAGGGAILSEVPEMLGAEQVLMTRMRSGAVVEDFRRMISWYQEMARTLGVVMSDNLVPENKAGGLINACIKSLGA